MTGFKKATKEKIRLRMAVFGPSGSGKTFSALRIAKGLGGKIALMDSEVAEDMNTKEMILSSDKYADQFDFDNVALKGFTIDEYVKWIGEAAKGGYGVLIIDSLSHAWQELLEEIDRLAKSKYQNNSWAAWNEGTPKQKKLINAILSFPGHLIVTMRSKTEWVVEKNESTGKATPKRVGLAPEQGKGIEYEFDILVEINHDHYATIIKDRTGKFQDKILQYPDETFGSQIGQWLQSSGGEESEFIKELNNVGLKLYGNGWDLKSKELTETKTKGRVSKVELLTNKEAQDITKALIKNTTQIISGNIESRINEIHSQLNNGIDNYLIELDRDIDSIEDSKIKIGLLEKYNKQLSELNIEHIPSVSPL